MCGTAAWNEKPRPNVCGSSRQIPSVGEVVPVRDARAVRVRAHLATLSEDDLRVRVGGPWDPPDLPPERRARVIDCFRVVFREEWWHHQFATRDLAVIQRD